MRSDGVKREKAERLADEELMPLIGDKDPEAFEVFYDRHGGVAYSLAYRIVGERATAEDVTQEAFISIWRSGARFDRARGSVRSWMLSIVRNRAIDVLRSSAGKAPKLTFDDDSILEQRPAEELTEEEAMRHETASEVRGALGQLPGDQSKVIELAYFGGFSQSEIARMLGVPLGTVKGRMRLAWRRSAASWRRDWHDERRARALERGRRRLHARRARGRGGGRVRAPPRGLRTTAARAALVARRRSRRCRKRSSAPAPPPQLRERLMEEVRADARAAAASTRSAESGARGWLARLLHGSGAHGWRPLAGLAAVALVVVAFAGYEIGNGGSGSGRRRDQHDRRRQGAGGHRQGRAQGRLRRSCSSPTSSGCPHDRVLEAWVQRDGEVEPVQALFVPDRDGQASTTIADMSGVEVVMVTTEPSGGSEAPTSSPIVTVPIPG